jgi:hypothetical protein
MLETSKDVLNIVIAVSVFGVSFFVCWALYYFVMILRQMFKGVQEVKNIINRVDETIKAFKEKIESSASYLFLIGEGVKKMVDLMKYKSEGDDENDKKKKK